MNQLYNFIKPCLLIFIFTATSCTLPAFFQNEKQSEEFYEEEYNEATELVLGADSIFQYWFSYEFKDGDFWIFYVHLVNYSVLSAQFDPSACYLEYENRNLDLPDELKLRVYAINPEVEIQLLAQEKEDAQDRNSLDLGFNIVSAVVDIAANVFDGETGNDIEIFEDLFHWSGNISGNIEQSKMDSEYFEESEMFWQNDILRKTIIQSGEETGGLVYFPIQKRTPEFSAIIPFGGTSNLFEITLAK